MATHFYPQKSEQGKTYSEFTLVVLGIFSWLIFIGLVALWLYASYQKNESYKSQQANHEKIASYGK